MNVLKSRSGFTMIEILLAAVLFSVISSFIYSVLTTSLEASKEAGKWMDINHTGRFFINRIKRDLLSASLMPNSESGIFKGSDMMRDGKERDEVYFTSFTRSYFTLRPQIDQAEIAYYFQILEDEPDILMRRESDVIDDNPQQGGEAYAITYMVDEMKLRYKGNLGWVDNWDSIISKRLPRAVSVELTLNDSGRSYFFSTIVRIPS
ncbi:MAG: type II secretory pathway [bacterium]|nr:MAG: type II secretory pathway [bacterium]